MASGEEQLEEGASIQDVKSHSTLSASANAFVPAAIPESSTPTALFGDPEATAAATLASTSATSKKKRWPAYFFPSLATQRMAFCLDVLKREDIKSVREFMCAIQACSEPST